MVSGYPTSTNLLRVDELSTDPRDLGRHNNIPEEATPTISKIITLEEESVIEVTHAP